MAKENEMAHDDRMNNRILVVDDQEEMHQSFEDILSRRSTSAGDLTLNELGRAFSTATKEDFLPAFELLHAQSGEEGVGIVKTSIEANRPIAVAFIDVRMPPGIDGIETARCIREIDKSIEIVIMTAFADKSLAEIIAGVKQLDKQLYLRKPAEREEVQQMAISLTEKWNVQRELEINRSSLESVLDATGDAIIMFDITGRVRFANRWFRQMFQVTSSELEGKPVEEVRLRLRPCFLESERFDQVIRSIFDNPGQVYEGVMNLVYPQSRALYRISGPVRNSADEIIGRLILYRDISKELEIEQMKAEISRLQSDLQARYTFDSIIGKSPNMQAMFTLMQQAAMGSISVLIYGESGTGKELVARAIHFNSSRKNKPFIAVNCGAIPETLIESELFGHERGAFTGAVARRIGKFEQANGGTIFLDEIGEMPYQLQVRLLRVLQEKEIQRVGGVATASIDVRVIAATNKDLEAAMKAGKFREDLYYRLAAFPIHVPPLREHREDVPGLAEHFLMRYAGETGKSIKRLSPVALHALMAYDWPGNIRELENAIERAVLVEEADVLQASSLPPHLLNQIKPQQISAPAPQGQAKLPPEAEIRTLEELEKEAIGRTLKATGNNIRQTAKLLGINRATLYRKIKRYGLNAEELEGAAKGRPLAG
jgi:PAS domain S-box-containing protein